MKSKALFLILHRKDRSPGQRYRHEQYVSHLEANGVECDFSPLLDANGDELFYGSGRVLQKILIGLSAFVRRLRDMRRLKNYDMVYVYRDAFFFGTFFERRIAKSNAKLIFDFDDAIWLMDKNPNQGVFNRLKNPKKTAKIIALADQVIVGNDYLKNYAFAYNSNVRIIPSTVDFDKYTEPVKKAEGKICIGWTGSFSTIKHFETILPALEEIKSMFGDRVCFKLIGEPNYRNETLEIEGVPWKSETEAVDLGELDIGVMPLPDNKWTRGKCAMKGLQYMALGIPTIMSPVGVNSEIIDDGSNGMLARTSDDWVRKLSLLIEDESLRTRIGEEGRKTARKDFSVEANKEKWLAVFSNKS